MWYILTASIGHPVGQESQGYSTSLLPRLISHWLCFESQCIVSRSFLGSNAFTPDKLEVFRTILRRLCSTFCGPVTFRFSAGFIRKRHIIIIPLQMGALIGAWQAVSVYGNVLAWSLLSRFLFSNAFWLGAS